MTYRTDVCQQNGVNEARIPLTRVRNRGANADVYHQEHDKAVSGLAKRHGDKARQAACS